MFAGENTGLVTDAVCPADTEYHLFFSGAAACWEDAAAFVLGEIRSDPQAVKGGMPQALEPHGEMIFRGAKKGTKKKSPALTIGGFL
ncbi:MAG: hypothetical protein IKI77_08940 [Oscillospiraceae bacterium]|nr:hypothetical protein [Oscillospiraceae bacterium]